MAWLIVLVLAVLTIIIFGLKFYIYGNDDYWPKKKIPFIAGSQIGSFWDRLLIRIPFNELDDRVYRQLKALGRQVKYGGVMEFRRPVAFIMDLELVKVKNILVKDFDHFINRRAFGIRKDDPSHFGRVLFSMEGQEWKDTRAMSPTFTTGKIRKMFQIFNESSMKMVKYLQEEISSESSSVNGKELDCRDPCSRFTMDSSAFGIMNFKDKNSMFSLMGRRIQAQFRGFGAFRLFAAFLLPGLFKALKLNFMDLEACQFFEVVTRKTIAHRKKTGERREDFIQMLLDARDGQLVADDHEEKDGAGEQVQPQTKVSAVEWTDELIVAQGLLFFLAGFDTTETLLLYALYELALNPEIQERLAQEIQRAASQEEEGQQLPYDLINQNEYLDMVISETLRKYPPASRTERRCTLEYQIPGTPMIIPEGQICLIPIYSIHHDPDYYPEPNKFLPEILLQKIRKIGIIIRVGPRNCIDNLKKTHLIFLITGFLLIFLMMIAMRFAIKERKAAIANLVRHFKFEPCEKTSVPIEFDTNSAMKPKNGMWLKLSPRTNESDISNN